MGRTDPQCADCGAEYSPAASFCPVCGSATPTILSGQTQKATGSTPGRPGDNTGELLQKALGPGFKVQALLGSGSFGTVFRARDVRLERDVAIKVLRREYLVSPEFVRRFEQEARALAALRHPNIVQVYDIGVSDDLVYLIMPMIQGETLASYLRTHPGLSLTEAARLVHGIASGLSAAHKAGFVHRDIKPENVMIEGDDHRPLLMDFGIAKAFRSGQPGETQAGTILGTPLYMSPEQATADPHIDHRSDIYSLGVLAFEVFTGALPFRGETGQDLIHQHVLVPPPDPRQARPELPDSISDAILRALAKKPGDRFQSADEFSRTLDGLAPRPRIDARSWLSARSRSLMRAAAVLALLVVAGIAARMGTGPVAVTPVVLDVRAKELRFTLATAQPIWGEVAELDRLGAANLDSVIVPAVGAGSGQTLAEPVVQLTAKRDSATGVISFDPMVFPAHTSVVLSGGLSDSTLRFTLGDSLPVLPISVDGPIELIAGGPPQVLRFTLQRLQLLPSNTGMELEVRPRQPQKTGLGPMLASHVSFERVQKIREGDQAKDVLSSTVTGGTIQATNSLHGPRPLPPGADLALPEFAGTISGIAMDTAGLSLRLEGTVHGIPDALGGMPARWEAWWAGARWQTVGLTIVWLGLLVGLILPRGRRTP
jgi:hypothetical protein